MIKRNKFGHVSVVIPAYNESKNLRILVTNIVKMYPQIKGVVVDDSDKDENKESKKIISQISKKFKVLSRLKKQGRGSAVMEGIKYSLKDKGIRVIVEMDADLAHDPKDLALFLDSISVNDMVVGSRYRKGSKIVEWPLFRLVQSKIINFFLKIWLGLNLSDYTNGYRAYSREAAEFLAKQRLREKGFISLSETAFKLRKGGFKISEVATTFRDRKFGESSADFKELLASLCGAIRIRFSNGLKFEFKPFYFGVISLVFVYLNYSFFAWNFLNKNFGLVAAKIIPEIMGIVFFTVLSKIYLSKSYPDFKLNLKKVDFMVLLFLVSAGLLFHLKQFNTYFWKDDFYFFLNRGGTGYGFYSWGPWISSYPLWTWEFVRSAFGLSIFPYQVATILSHALLAFGVYLLVKYSSKSILRGIFTAFLVVSTSITFEAFQWQTQPINFGWQGFVVCLSLIALVWELKQTKGFKTPYLSSFVMMSAFGAGIARIGFVLPLMSAVSFFILIEYLHKQRLWIWVSNLVRGQLIYYFMVVTFFITRGLFVVRGTKSEDVTTALSRIYLYLVGVSSAPIEFFVLVSKNIRSLLLPGVLFVWFGFGFLLCVLFILGFLVVTKRKIPLTLIIGFFWLVLSALFLAPFAPHLPSTNFQIDHTVTTHHLSYLTSVGSLIIWGFVISEFLVRLTKYYKRVGYVLGCIVIVSIVFVNFIFLSKQYDTFLDFPAGVKITRQQFFFDTYRRYIPADEKPVNIFYDNGAMARKDNFKPNEYYYWAFWNPKDVRIFYGESDLQKYFKEIGDLAKVKKEVENLYYIYTSYDNGLLQEDLSQSLRVEINKPGIQRIGMDRLRAYWGKKYGNTFTPELLFDNTSRRNYFKNPVLLVNNLNFPAVLTPTLNMRFDIRNVSNSSFVDLRAGIFAQLLNNWDLPSDDQFESLIKYYSANPSQSNLALNDLLNSTHVADKMVCEPKVGDSEIIFLVVWLGEPDSYLNSQPPDVKNPIAGYLDRYYSICAITGNASGEKTLNTKLPNLGSVLRAVVIIPISKYPISIQVLDTTISSPQILK